MAMLDVSCDNCGRSFRVRAEFAGKSTRCPGCSKPMEIGAPGKAVPPPVRDDYDDAPRRPQKKLENTKNITVSTEWKNAMKGFGREQAAVRFLGVQVLADLVAFCLIRGIGPLDRMPALLVVVFLLLFVGPAIMSVIMGISARTSVLNLPADARAGGSAWSSMICALGGLFSVLLLGLSFLMSLEGNRRDSEPLLILSMASGALMTFGALLSFSVVIAQVGIATASKEISGAIGRMAIATTVCVVITLVLGGCISAVTGAFTPHHNPFGGGPNFEPFFALAVFSSLITAIVLLIFYHSLLSHAKKGLQNTGISE